MPKLRTATVDGQMLCGGAGVTPEGSACDVTSRRSRVARSNEGLGYDFHGRRRVRRYAQQSVKMGMRSLTFLSLYSIDRKGKLSWLILSKKNVRIRHVYAQ